ncbi:hypothetical protein [Sorangium sp. So ce406]|uniref:hypothetical protein n=1 Tax=Sorangium sp. So ce406 TaxID=3133311 RepID=UPI003F5C5ADA
MRRAYQEGGGPAALARSRTRGTLRRHVVRCRERGAAAPPGGKPAADVTRDEAPADGTKVKLRTRDTARLAGIVTAKAVERQGGGIPATVRIVYDALEVAEINARAPGVGKKLFVDVGSEVEKGAPPAVIDSADVGASAGGRAARSGPTCSAGRASSPPRAPRSWCRAPRRLPIDAFPPALPPAAE